MWVRIWGLIIKELLVLLRDKRSRFVLIVPPVAQLLIFGYAASFDLNHIPYAVYNQDRGIASRELLARFAGAPAFSLVSRIQREAQIAPLLNSKQALLVLRIGPNFTADLLSRRPASVQVLVDGRNSNTAALALTDVNSILLAFNEHWAKAHGWGQPPAYLVFRAWFNPNLLSRWFIVPGIVALLTLVVTLLVTGLSVAREREQGTFDQLLVTPLTPLEILLGKSLPGLFIGFLEGLFIILVAVFWFHVPLRGELPALALGLLLFLLAAIGIGLTISSLASTQQQGLLGVFLFLVPAVILSGFATPIANMPPLIQDLTLLNPMRYFLVIVRGVFLEGDGFSTLYSQYWPLALIAILSLGLASWLFRHRLG